MKSKISLTIIFTFLFIINASSQVKNNFYLEIHTFRLGQKINDNYWVTDGHEFSFLNGGEVGYGILDKLNISARVRTNSLFKIKNSYFEDTHNQRLEWSLGIEYIRKIRTKFHFSYGIGFFHNKIKYKEAQCLNFRLQFKEGNHRRVFQGGFLQMNFNYPLSSKIHLVVSSRYRFGKSILKNDADFLQSSVFCGLEVGKKENLEVISKVAIRFFL